MNACVNRVMEEIELNKKVIVKSVSWRKSYIKLLFVLEVKTRSTEASWDGRV